MTKHRLFWLAFAVCLALAAFWLFTRPDRINRENFGKIQFCNSLEEVESLLGAPATLASECGGIEFTWVGKEGTIGVRLTGENKITECYWDQKESFFDKLRRWIGLEAEPKPPRICVR